MEIAFWIIATVCVVAALGVVMLRDIFRSALFLILCFLGVAGIFILLSADFLAAVQILIYVGAISVLIILAIMLLLGVLYGYPLAEQVFESNRQPLGYALTVAFKPQHGHPPV